MQIASITEAYRTDDQVTDDLYTTECKSINAANWIDIAD